MNGRFISVKLQLDTSDQDDARVKNWYKPAREIAEAYKIKASPTYLVFDPNGKAVHRSAGQVQTGGEFIEKTKISFDPASQYFTLLGEYKQGKKDSAFLRKLTKAVISAYDQANMQAIINDYLDTQQNLYTPENLALLPYVTTTSHDRGFKVMLSNPQKVNDVLGKGEAENRTHGIMISEEIVQKYPQNEPDWNEVATNLAKKYPLQADEVIAKAKFRYYQSKHDWDRFQYALVGYMKIYEDKCSNGDLNNYAWMIFENCSDVGCLSEAVKWSRHSFEDNNNPGFMDTYANLLYKLGKKEEAIAWEIKAMELSSETDKQFFRETIEKMKNGEKTWH